MTKHQFSTFIFHIVSNTTRSVTANAFFIPTSHYSSSTLAYTSCNIYIFHNIAPNRCVAVVVVSALVFSPISSTYNNINGCLWICYEFILRITKNRTRKTFLHRMCVYRIGFACCVCLFVCVNFVHSQVKRSRLQDEKKNIKNTFSASSAVPFERNRIFPANNFWSCCRQSSYVKSVPTIGKGGEKIFSRKKESGSLCRMSFELGSLFF